MFLDKGDYTKKNMKRSTRMNLIKNREKFEGHKKEFEENTEMKK